MRPTLKCLTVIAVLLGAGFLILTPAASAQSVRGREEASRVLTVEKVAINNGEVSGEVFNHSTHIVRDVQLFIRHTWLWDNETKPGKDDPGTSVYYTLPKEIPPGERAPFNFKPPVPLTNAGGRFETSVAVAGFTEVIPQPK
jgi:hypothetical protein